jgi:hypothetical protein
MTTTDHRQAAKAAVETIITRLKAHAQPAAVASFIEECEALVRAIGAFHMEGIRFRMYNVDRHLARSGVELPAEVRALFADARHELEAAGFHTRSHQAPT